MLHACAARFDVTENIKNFLLFDKLNKAEVRACQPSVWVAYYLLQLALCAAR